MSDKIGLANYNVIDFDAKKVLEVLAEYDNLFWAAVFGKIRVSVRIMLGN